jgi:hypothetical protein
MIVLSFFRSARLAMATGLMLVLLAVVDCDAADAPAVPSIQSVSLGVDGLMKPGSWCRIRATVSGSDLVRVEAVTPDPLGNPVIYSSPSFESEENTDADVFIKPGRLLTTITVRVVKDSDGTVLDSRRLVSAGTPGSNGDFRVVKHSVPTALFCGGFSTSSILTENDDASEDNEGSAALLTELRDSGAEVSRIDPRDLPTDWRTLAAYRTIVLSREFDLPADQSLALEQWVSQGGHLVIAAGVGARTLAARTPGENASAILDLLDAGGLRELQTQTLANVLAALEVPDDAEIRDAGISELTNKPLNELPEALNALKLEPAKSRQLRDLLRGLHRDLVLAVQLRLNTTLKDGVLGAWAASSATLTATTLSDLTGLETFISSSWSIPVSGRHWGAIIADENAKSLASGLEGTLLSRNSYGCGRVTLCGVALDQSPISRWKEAGTFLQALVEQPVEDTTETRDRRRISSSGIEEIGTQLYAAVESVPKIEDRNTLEVLGMTLLYLLLIGAVDYYLVHRLLKKPHLTWMTFPLAVVLAGLLGNATASTRNSGNVETQRLEIVDFDQVSQFTRTTTLSTVFSPEHARYEIEVPHLTVTPKAESTQAASNVSWFGFPEANYGGMYRSAGIETGRPQYRISPGGQTFENLPIAIWSDRVVASESVGQFAAGLIESDLKRSGTGQLHRDSTITHHLPFALKNWVLIHGNRAYYHDVRSGGLLDDTSIAPGQAWTAGDRTVTGREVRSFLTAAEFRFTKDTSKTSTGGTRVEKRLGKWDSRSTSLRDIVQMLTFHEVAGGSKYTSLSNSALQELELSEHIDNGRAVLLAEADGHVSSLRINGQEAPTGERDSTTTIVRILLPVTEAPIVRALPKFNE